MQIEGENGQKIEAGKEWTPRIIVTQASGREFECDLLGTLKGGRIKVRYDNGNEAELGDLEMKSWKYAPGQPVEVEGNDIRTGVLPGVYDFEGAPAGKVLKDSGIEPSEETAKPPTGPAGTEAADERVSDKPPRRSTSVAVERFGNIDRDVQTFLARLRSWDVGSERQAGHDERLENVECAWEVLGQWIRKLDAMKVSVRQTSRSKRKAWMREGAPVDLREDILKEWGEFYSADVLENLQIQAVGNEQVFLRSGDRELGPVPKAHVLKKGQRGKSDSSTAK